MPNERETIREIMTRIAILPPKERADALEKLVILSGLRKLYTIVMEEVKEMSITIDVMENAFLRDLYLKAEQQGEANMLTNMLTRQLQRRFGTVPEWVNEKIAKANLTSLQEWSLRFVDAKTLDEVLSGQEHP